MHKFLLFTIINLGLVTGCSMGSSTPVTVPLTVASSIPASDAPILLAEQAYQDKQRLILQYQQADKIQHVSATLPSLPGSANAQHPDHANGTLPMALLVAETPEATQLDQVTVHTLPIYDVASWLEFRNRLCTSITPRKPGNGVVVDFLMQEELFFYFDAEGFLRSVPVHDKPAKLRIANTYRFSELLVSARHLLNDYTSTAGDTPSPAVIFNTGDSLDYGYPFIYANQRTGQIIFLRRLPPSSTPTNLPLPTEAHAQTVMHATFSHVGGMLMQPVTSLSRLFSLVTYKTKDTLSYKPLVLLEKKPVPPVANLPPMDPLQWEHELDLLTASPPSQGQLHYLVDGAAFFARLIDSVQSAQESIDIRLYIFDNDDYALKIADLLKRRSREVKVRILVDGLGTLGAGGAISATTPENYRPPASIINYLQEDSQVEVRVLQNPWLTGDHTKTIVIDRHTAFLGGMNIGREYRYDWHDLMVELHGPVVDILHTEFELSWLRESFLGDFRAGMYRPGPPHNTPQPDDVPIRILQTLPGDSQILRSQLAAISRAQQRIYIENAYFTSDVILFELAKARRRGVDVRVIIPYRGDSGIINRSHVLTANAMLANGIRVYIYPGTSHMKGALYDGWLCLGSANFDDLSLRVNKELNIATADPATVQNFLDQVLLPDLKKSVELKEPIPKKWSDYLMELMADYL